MKYYNIIELLNIYLSVCSSSEKYYVFDLFVMMYLVVFIYVDVFVTLVFKTQPQQRTEGRGDETNRRTRAKPQSIVGQAYSHTYSTLSQLSRLQTICLGDSSKFRFTNINSALCFC